MPQPPIISSLKTFAKSPTARLAASYLAIIMLMSVGFSVVFFNASLHEFNKRPARPDNQTGQYESRPRIERNPELETYLEARAEEAHHALLERLIILNLIALAAGSALSYYLARRTLTPIEENMEAQAQFVSDASHELRTPLTALQTTNEVALRKPKLSEAEARDLLGHNVAEVAKLQALTTALLKLAKPDNPAARPVPVSLQTAASEAMNAMVAAAQAKDIAIEDKVPDIRVLGDPTALAQSVAILLDNAIKYSPQGSTIHLSGGKAGRHGSITVTDQGQGIAAKDLPHIFDRFYRADQSRTRSIGTSIRPESHTDGYGIGLSLAKKLVHQMDGEILASSIEGKGSSFAIRLPLA